MRFSFGGPTDAPASPVRSNVRGPCVVNGVDAYLPWSIAELSIGCVRSMRCPSTSNQIVKSRAGLGHECHPSRYIVYLRLSLGRRSFPFDRTHTNHLAIVMNRGSRLVFVGVRSGALPPNTTGEVATLAGGWKLFASALTRWGFGWIPGGGGVVINRTNGKQSRILYRAYMVRRLIAPCKVTLSSLLAPFFCYKNNQRDPPIDRSTKRWTDGNALAEDFKKIFPL